MTENETPFIGESHQDGCPVCGLFSTMQHAHPETTAHLANAGRELLAAVRCFVDAAEQALDEQYPPDEDEDAFGGVAGRDAVRAKGTQDQAGMSGPTIGLDVGGTNTRAALVDADGAILDERKVPSPTSWDEMTAAMIGLIQGIQKDAPDVAAVGAGCAGLVDLEGRVAYSPNVPAFRDADVMGVLADALRVPVIVDNDANAAAYGEVAHGSAQGYHSALVITLGTGIGGGIVVNDRVLRGAHGYAGEVGHFTIDPSGPRCACGQRGHWEALASGNALGHIAREAIRGGGAPSVLAEADGDPEAVSGVHVGKAALKGAPDALALLDEYAEQVGIGLGALANIIDPGVIVIGGGLVTLGEVIMMRVRAAFARHIEGGDKRSIPPVVGASLGDDAGVIGAAALARSIPS